MKPTTLTVLIGLTLLPLGSLSQWSWIDNDGHKVFSDRSPPAAIPEKNILKRPGQAAAPPAATEATRAPSAPGSAAAPASQDKELEAKKKKADQAEHEKRKAEEAHIAQAKSDNCKRAKGARAGLEVGGRIMVFKANGDREPMDESARKAEIQRIQTIIDTDCQ